MSEVILIEFLGNAKSGVAAANEQVAANKEVEASAKRASASTVTASKGAATSMAASGAAMSKVGKSMTKYISLPLLAIGAASAKMSLDFNRSMLEISTQAGGTRKEVAQLSKEILNLTAKGRFAQGPKELADALFHIESVGIRGAKAMKTLKAASDLATVGNADLESTTNALVGAMRTGIKGAGDMREAIGTMNATIGAGNLRMDELTAAFGTGFLTSAKQVGLTLRDAGAALAELTSQGIPATSAATRLRMSFTLMAAPTEKAKKVLAEIGIGSQAMAKEMQKPNGLVNALKLLKEHLTGLTKVEQTQLLSSAFGGAKSGTTIMALIGQLGDLSKKYIEVGKNAGDFGKKLKETAEDPAVQWEKSWAKLQGALVEIGNEVVPALTPVLKEIADDVTAIASAFDSLSPGMKSFVVEVGIAAIAAGPLLRVLGGITSMAGKAGTALGVFEATSAAGGAGAAAGTAGQLSLEGAGLGAGGAGVLGGLFKSSGGIKGAAQVAGRTLAGLVGGYFVAELGTQIGAKAKLFKDPTEGQGIAKSLVHGFNTSGVAKTEIDALQKHRKENFKLTEGELKHLGKAFKATMTDLSVAGGAGLEEVNKQLQLGLAEADKKWISGTKPWRSHVTEAMQKAVHTIETGMQLGTVKVGKGQKEIDGLLAKIHMIRGKDPVGLAEAMAKSFKEVHGITAAGMKQWTSDLSLMPKAAREKAIDANQGILKAWAEGHPKVEKQINSLSTFILKKFGATNQQLREGVKKGATGPIAEAYREAALGIGGALDNIGINTSQLLKALGMHSFVEFQAKVLGPQRSPQLKGPEASEAHHHQKFRRGGPIHEGASSGDTVPAMLERGEYVLNKKAVARVGKGTLDQINFHEAPRFAQGGGIEVTGHGPGALGQIGKGSLTKAMAAAQHFINAHAPKEAAGTGGVSLKGISGSVASMAAQIVKRAHSPQRATLALFEALWAESSMGSAAPGNVLEALEPYTKIRPAPEEISGFLTGHPTWTGTAAIPLARSTGLPAHAIAQLVQKSGVGEGNEGRANYLVQKGRALATMAQFGLAKGGLFGMAAGGMARLGNPSRLRQTALEHGSATAESVVAWAKHFLGSGDRWGYPGEWCGAFVGADMLKHGIQPPSDYPLAAAWGKWGSPAAGPEFGNVVVIGGSGHVGIGLGGGKMISGNLSDSVAISSVAEAAGGRPVTGYRLPPYVSGGGGGGKRKPVVPKQLHGKFATHKAGDTSKGGGTFAETGRASYTVQTAPLSFSSVPSSITGCRRELRERQRDLTEYKAAIRQAKSKETRKALEANVKKIQQRIKELIRAIGELIKKRKRERQVHKIEGHGLFPKIEEAIANRSRGYDEASEYAEQVVALEPEENAAGYIAGREGPAWQKVLNQESQWRNAILTGETVAATRLGSLEKQLHSVEGLRGSPAFNKQRWRIAPLKTAIASIKGVWNKNQHGVSGSFEEGLEGLQGPGKSHALMENLPAEPVAGSFGGLIFDTQMTIRELGLKLKGEAGGAEDNSGLLEAEKAIAEQALRGQRLAELQYGPLSEFLKHMPPHIGAFKTGGQIPGGINQAYTATVHGGEEIVPAGGGSTYFNLHLHGDMANAVDSAMPGMVKEVDRRMGQSYRRITYGPGAKR